MDGPCSWLKRCWTDRSKVGTPGDPVRGTAAAIAIQKYEANNIAHFTSPDEQDHEAQRLAA